MQEQLNFDDIFGLWEPHWWENPWLVLCFFVVLVLTVFLIVYCVKSYRGRSLPVDPRVRALSRLSTIRPIKPFETQDEYKSFYVTLLALVKEYFDGCYGLACSGKTDRELLIYAQNHYKISHYQDMLQMLVEHGFSVKFAQDSATYDRVKADYERVLAAVSGPVES